MEDKVKGTNGIRKKEARHEDTNEIILPKRLKLYIR
jgi:hypothetical protein